MKSDILGPADVKALPFYTLLEQGLLIVAFDRLKRYCEKKMLYELSDELSRLEQSYLYMIKYALSGTPDPRRDDIRASIVSRLADIYEHVRRFSQFNRSGHIYVTMAKSLSKFEISAVISEYLSQITRQNDFETAMSSSDNLKLKQSVEGLERTIFNLLWTTHPLRQEHIEAVNQVLAHKSTPVRMRRLIAGALMLGNLSYWDDARFALLADIYTGDDNVSVAMSALIGIVMSLDAHRHRPLSRDTRHRLESLREIESWQADLRSVTIELVRAYDTKRISEQMTDYFKNTFSQVSDEVRQSIKDLSKIEDLTDLEDNPEWMDMLDRTGIAEKMRELNDLQEEGGDIFMQPFRHLKGDSFFFEIANWFLPFDTSLSSVERADPDRLLSEMVASAPMLCDSDKYSFIFALGSVPEPQRKIMMSQLEAGNLQAQAEAVSSLNLGPDSRRRVANSLIQSLYRFFNLNRYSAEIVNPFHHAVNATSIEALAVDFNDETMLEMVAEFYFKHKYYELALQTLLVIEQKTIPTAELYQRIGYCYQRVGHIAEAITYYEQAELLNSRSVWTLKRLAQCYMLSGRSERALPYYERIVADNPDDLNTLVALARCKMSLGDYAGALPHLYQARYLKPDSDKYAGLLAWTLLASGDKDKARKLFDEIITGSPSRGDKINCAHLALIDGEVDKAISLYMDGIGSDEDFDATVGAIANDFKILSKFYPLDNVKRDMLIEALTAARLRRN